MSLQLQPDTTQIRRLTVRGPSDTRQRLISRLEAAHWPAPSDGSWVLVRRVAAVASKHSLAEELLQTTRQQINSADPSDVVRFRSLAALLAALVNDICRGVADQRWYWQRWSGLWPLPAGDAIQKLLQEHPRQLVAVCYFLASDRNLATVWQRLSEENAAAIIRSVRYELGLESSSLDPAMVGQNTGGRGVAIPEQQVRAWQPILNSLPKTDPRSELAVLIIAIDSAALALCTAPNRTLAMIRQRIAQPRSDREPAAHSSPMADAAQRQNPGQTRESATWPKAGPTQSTKVSSAPEARPLPASNPANPAIVKELSMPDIEQPAMHRATLESGNAQATPEAQHDESRSGNVRTDMGGTLYLLNVLNRPAVQAIMAQAWQSLPNGWAWLYRLAQELDLDPNDPLCDFLAERLGLESATELDSLPELPERESVLALAAQWFQQEDLWSPALIRVPGELAYTPGHLDLYQDNSQVRLEVRLAGLDLNPGWLPWLGTVVTFHFDHFPHLQRATS